MIHMNSLFSLLIRNELWEQKIAFQNKIDCLKY